MNDSDDDSDESIHLYSGSLSEKLKQMSQNPTRQDNRENIVTKNSKIFSSTSLSSSCNSLCSNESIKKLRNTIHLNNKNNHKKQLNSKSISKIYQDDLSKSQQQTSKLKSLPVTSHPPTPFKVSNNFHRNILIKKNNGNAGSAGPNSSSSTTHLQFISNSNNNNNNNNNKLIKDSQNKINGAEELGDASSASYLVSSVVNNNNNNNNSSKQLNSRQQQLIKLKNKQLQKQQQLSKSNLNGSNQVEEETKSENFLKQKKLGGVVMTTADRSNGISEPIKSILDAIVSLSSLDTLNDIDSDDDNEQNNDDDEDEDDDDDDESLEQEQDQPNNTNNGNFYFNHTNENYSNHHHHMHYNNAPHKNMNKKFESSYAENHLYRYEPNDYYNNNNNQNINNNDKMLIDQDWSYSLNSNAFSGNEQRLIAEIVRKLKPIINKCVKKEIKNFMEQQQQQQTNNNNNNANNMKEVTKKNFINQLDKNSLTNIGDF